MALRRRTILGAISTDGQASPRVVGPAHRYDVTVFELADDGRFRRIRPVRESMAGPDRRSWRPEDAQLAFAGAVLPDTVHFGSQLATTVPLIVSVPGVPTCPW
jgi:hypothetical protein